MQTFSAIGYLCIFDILYDSGEGKSIRVTYSSSSLISITCMLFRYGQIDRTEPGEEKKRIRQNYVKEKKQIK